MLRAFGPERHEKSNHGTNFRSKMFIGYLKITKAYRKSCRKIEWKAPGKAPKMIGKKLPWIGKEIEQKLLKNLKI